MIGHEVVKGQIPVPTPAEYQANLAEPRRTEIAALTLDAMKLHGRNFRIAVPGRWPEDSRRCDNKTRRVPQ
jgi:hypothetical protein